MSWHTGKLSDQHRFNNSQQKQRCSIFRFNKDVKKYIINYIYMLTANEKHFNFFMPKSENHWLWTSDHCNVEALPKP